MILFRHFLSLRGRLSANRYRRFLLIYLFCVLPLFSFLYFAFILIGYRGSGRIFQFTNLWGWGIASIFYFVSCLWPLVVATIRRLHDLGFKGHEHLFTFSPLKTIRLGKELLFTQGVDRETTQGENPGLYEDEN